MYSKRFGVDPEKLQRKLWGDSYFDSETKQWTTHNTSESGKPLTRAFVEFILNPIYKLFRVIIDKDPAQIAPILSSIDIQIDQ